MNGSLVSPNNTISKAECSNGSKEEKPTRTTCDCHQNETVKQQSNWKPQLKLIIACMLTLSFMIAEIIGGILSNSLAILTDAAHMLSDFSGFVIGIFSIWVATRSPSKRMSFGWYRAEVIGTLISVLMIWIITGILVYKAIERIIDNVDEINADVMLIISCIGLYVNVFVCAVLHQPDHSKKNSSQNKKHCNCCHFIRPWKKHVTELEINPFSKDEQKSTLLSKRHITVHAAYVHGISDLVQGIGVLVAGYIIRFFPQLHIVDPICTFLFSILAIVSTFGVVKNGFLVLMESVPSNIDINAIKEDFKNIPNILEVHSIHVWSLSINKAAFEAHLVIRNDADSEEILLEASDMLRNKYNFIHTNLQIEHYQEKMKNCYACQKR